MTAPALSTDTTTESAAFDLVRTELGGHVLYTTPTFPWREFDDRAALEELRRYDLEQDEYFDPAAW
ncbi:MAG TPA: hypothetical protein VGL46_17710 [Pseudonocardiaceae bacterium]